MKRLYILGAGGFGREVHGWLELVSGYGKDWEFAGFLDDNRSALDAYAELRELWAGPISCFVPQQDTLMVCAIADVTLRANLGERMQQTGHEFYSLIHPDAWVGPRVRIGSGCILCQRVTLTCDIELGRGVILNIGTSVGHNACLGDYCTLSGHCDITGYAKLGPKVFMGSHASVLPGVEVGEGVRIGAGCIVPKNLPSGTTWALMPPRQIG